MRIGIGLPNTIPGADGRAIVAWARRAEELGFAALATIDRIAYPSYESLVALAAAAGATERIELISNILLGPTRNPVLLAKESASLDQLSGGRFTLGAAVGGREDDYTVAGMNYHDRGRRWDAAIDLIQRAWRGESVAGSTKAITPRPVRPEGIPLLVGGRSDAIVERVVRSGAGWTAGGAAPQEVLPFAGRVRAAWQAAGRAGEPRIVALFYYALGPQARERGGAYLRDYYGAAPWIDGMIAGLPVTPDDVRRRVALYAEAGVDTVLVDPTIASPEQVDLLAEAAL
jgi:alkanesulfonate monooxygenase SsuD/methylene tetrahydromethanopterin reductase-like flavin-dependent oxidoreductase (luciferase family)